MACTTVTLVIHGTFAKDAEWWQLGSGESFADRLERELSRRGLVGTVWKPALAAGLDYSFFCWSGDNRHGDRVAGAHRLSSSLNELAKQVSASRNDPLIVNFVAHSHGGNVVLEAIRHLNPAVRVGRIALLGTPLITTRPAFRVARFALSAVLITMLFFFFIALVGTLASYLFTGKPLPTTDVAGGEEDGFLKTNLSLIAFYLIVPWSFWLLGNLLDIAWRLLCRILEPLAWLRGRARSLAYGPSPSKLKTILQGRPILLLTTRNDEADVLLQIGSTPGRLYFEYVRIKFSWFGRLLDLAFLRPLMLAVLLQAAEMLLQIFSLGFPVWRTLVLDFKAGSPPERPYYPGELLVQQWLDIHPKATTLSVPISAGVPEHDDTIQSDTAPTRGVYAPVTEIVGELKRQIRLRHSAYYENEEVTTRVVDFLTGVELARTERAQSSSIKLTPEFWEIFFLANVGLWVLCVCINILPLPSGWPPSRGWFSFQTMLYVWCIGFCCPLIFLGAGVALSARWQQLSVKVWRWFWRAWAICGLLVLTLAFTERLE